MRLGALATVNPRATLALRRAGLDAVAFRRSRVQIKGTVQGPGRLYLGSQWPGNDFFLPGHLLVAEGGTLVVAKEWRFLTGMRVGVDPGATLTLGSGGANTSARIYCFSSVTIGMDVFLAEDVVIRDSDNHQAMGSAQSPTAPIVIEDHVWVGMRSTILKGVTIGEGSIVAAGSVVTRDIPPHCMAAGVPAKVRKTDVNWRE